MSGNQKQAAAVGPQQSQRYQQTYIPRPPTPQQRPEFHAATSQTYVPQPPNQQGGQGPMRTIASAGPPNQASTPPNNDLKVQQMSQQTSMSLGYVPNQQQVRGGQNYFRQQAPNTQPQRMTNHRQGQQQQIYPQPYMQVPPVQQMFNVPVQYFNGGTRSTSGFVAPPFQVISGHQIPSFTYQQTQPPAPQPTFFYPPINIQRPGPVQPVPAGPQNPVQAPPPPISMAPAAPPHTMQRTNKRRSKAIPIINPNTGEDMLDELYESNSHPASGESSARQTPQPPNAIKEVQAAFAKQVAMAIGNSEMVDMEPPQQQQVPPMDHIVEHSAVVYQQHPPPSVVNQAVNNKLDHVLAYSKLQAQTKEFIPSNQNIDKEPPVVSALTDGAEVTINKQPKDRDSPGKSRKLREQQPLTISREQHKETPKVVEVQQPPVPCVAVSKEVTPERPIFVSENKVTEAPPPPPVVVSKDTKEVSNVTQRDDKKGQRKDKVVEQKVPVNVAGNQEVPEPVAPVASAPIAQENAAVSGKSKQNASHRKDGGKQQQSSQQNTQFHGSQKQSAPVPVPQSQPAKPNSKSSKIKDLNVKGATKEGTDMDAFNDNTVNASADVTNANITSSAPVIDNFNVNSVPVINANVTTTSGANDSNKRTDISNDTTTIKPPEVKVVPKSNKVDVTSIVKDNPNKTLKSYNIEAQDETDRASTLANDKLVQVKNEVNAKANAESNEDSGAIERPNIQYGDDQWSPHNPDGKKIYSRDFLLSLRNAPDSRKKPEFIQSELYKSILRAPGIQGGRTDFTPSFNSFMTKSSSQHGVASKRGSQNKMSSQNNKQGNKQNMIRVSISVREDVKLHESQNAWKPARLNTTGTVTEEEKKTEELYKKVRSVLNKLTPQKFTTLVTQVRNLTIDTTQRLQGVIDLVFEKAVDEPNFSYGYALLCKELALLQVPSTSADGKKKGDQEFVNFRKLLVTRCQMEFEKNSAEELDRNKRCEEIEGCTDPEKKKELQLQLEEDDRRIRRKSVGNIRFLGELFKQNMLTVNIILRCLDNLLGNKDEERLECLCKLLTTIGKEMEIDKGVNLSILFNTMKEIVDKKHGKVSSRVRFMLQDVIDLRKSKWVPRRQDTNPKTIDQIQKEAENEQLAIQAMNNSMPAMPRKDDRNNMGPNSDRKRRNTPDEGGWSTTPSRNRPTFTVQSDKLKNIRPHVDEPLGSGFGMWARGSNIKTPHPPPVQPVTANIYSALENIESDKKSLSGRSSSSKDPYSSKGPSMERPYKQYNDEGRGSRSSSRSGSQHRSNERTNSMQPPIAQPSAVAPPKLLVPAPIDPEQLERKIQNIIDEYLNDCCTVAECDQDIKASISELSYTELVSIGYLKCLERSKTARLKVGLLFANLIQLGTLSLAIYCTGLMDVLSQADDLRIDIPKVMDYLAEILVHPVCMEVLPLKVLHDSFGVVIGQGHAGSIIAPLFKMIVEDKGPNHLQHLWQASNLRFADFMPASMTDAFVKQNQLEFLLGNGDSPVGQSELTYEQIHEKLLHLFKAKASFDETVNWIIANVGDRVKEKKFIRTLATAIFEDSIVNLKLNMETLKGHYSLFNRFVDTDPMYELQCLYALQALINKLEHPQGILLQICGKLYEDEIFSQDSFVTWETSTDPAEQEGKGVAIKQLTSFFTQLKENDDEDFGSSGSDEA